MADGDGLKRSIGREIEHHYRVLAPVGDEAVTACRVDRYPVRCLKIAYQSDGSKLVEVEHVDLAGVRHIKSPRQWVDCNVVAAPLAG